MIWFNTLRLGPKQGTNGKWGYILGTGNFDDWVIDDAEKWTIEPKYDKAWPVDRALNIAQVKVDEEKSYIESYVDKDSEDVITDIIPREELGPDEKKYPRDRDHATYSGPNFIRTTLSAEEYYEQSRKNADYFYQIFKDAWFDYNDVSEILAKVIYDRSPNWGMTRYKTMNEIIAETEVWLIAGEDTKSGKSIKVKNRFTGEKENLFIPKDLGSGPDPRRWFERITKPLRKRDSLKKEPMNEQNEARLQEIEEELRKRYKELWGEDERTLTDWMGRYIPRTGTILIKIDSVDRVADLFGCPRDLLFQKVLLHEFIHAALDLWPRDADGNKISYHDEEWKTEDADGESFNEDSIDNAIVLKLYKGTPGYREVKGYIEKQPYYYRRAVELDKSKLLFLLRDLIAYKISTPVSTTSTVSP